jgi:hypothetical protein
MPQAKKFYYYIDWGAGYVEVDDFNNQLTRSIERGELNEYIPRLKLSGSLRLTGDDADDAFTYFITNGNYKVPMRLYENGTSGGGGVLKWEGWARGRNKYDISAEFATLNSFETLDQYTALIPFLDTEIAGESINDPDVLIRAFEMIAEGLNTSSNLIQAYTYTAPNWAPTGNTFALPYLGRVTSTNMSTSIVIYDNVTRDLRKFIYTAPNWSLSSLGTTYWVQNAGNGAVASISNSQVAFVDDFNNQIQFFTQTTGTWTLNSTNQLDSLQYPDLALLYSVTGVLALIDEGTKMLKALNAAGAVIGTPYSVGDVLKPSICSLDTANYKIAMVDGKSQSLKAFEYTPGTGVWAQISDNFPIGAVQAPKVSQDSVGTVIVHDSSLGTMQAYTLTGTLWATTGNSIAITGGIYGTISPESGTMGAASIILGSIQSDTYKQYCRPARAYITMVNGLLSSNGIYSGTDYVLNVGTNGATFDVSKTLIGNLATLKEVYLGASTALDNNKYTLRQLLDFAAQFQNYWYVEEDHVALGDFQIKFTQPVNFSSVGTNYSMTAFDTVLNQPDYTEQINLDRERINYQNARNTDFTGDDILYNRNTNIEESEEVKYTSDWGFQVDFQLGNEFEFSQSGDFMVFGEDTAMGAYETLFLVEAGTGVSGSTNVRNEELSKARIQEDYWKDYRYITDGNFTLNGNTVAAQNTARLLVKYPDIKQKLSVMPDSIGSLNFTSRDTWITAARTSLSDYHTTFENRILDI